MSCDEDEKEVNTKRAPHFTEAECLALSEAVAEKIAILDGSFSPTLTFAKKKAAWAYVLECVNSVSSYKRTLKQIQEKHKNMKKNGKAAEAHNRKEMKRTGGGKADIKELTQAELNILATIPAAAISGIEGGIDTSDITSKLMIY